jgi:hypothetical protein
MANILYYNSDEVKIMKLTGYSPCDEKYFQFYDDINGIYYHFIKKEHDINSYHFFIIPFDMARLAFRKNIKFGVICKFKDKYYKWLYNEKEIMINYNVLDNQETRDLNIWVKHLKQIIEE